MERISVQREVNGDGAAALGALVAATRAFAAGSGLADGQAQRLSIVIEELAANAFGHGGARNISVGLEVMGGAIRILMREDGRPFDLRQHESGDGPDPETGGGSGIAMISAWCDVVGYTPGRDGNHLDLVLRIRT